MLNFIFGLIIGTLSGAALIIFITINRTENEIDEYDEYNNK